MRSPESASALAEQGCGGQRLLHEGGRGGCAMAAAVTWRRRPKATASTPTRAIGLTMK